MQTSTPHSRHPEDITTEIPRRTFVAGIAGGASACVLGNGASEVLAETQPNGDTVAPSPAREDLFAFVRRSRGDFDNSLYRQLLGACNEFKEGDASMGVVAEDDDARQVARVLLANTRVGDLRAHPVFEDPLLEYISTAVDQSIAVKLDDWMVGKLKRFLLQSREADIKKIMPGLTSDVIACAVKLMTNDELIAVGSKVFNPLPGTKIGAKGFMGARIQPNSPTDDVDDIQWQVFCGFSYAVGDVLLGTNPVSSEVASVAKVEAALAEILQAFELRDVMPHCVLAHVDVQAKAEQLHPGSTALWFQSLAGVEDANETFDISVSKMRRHAEARTGKYGFYFETGQGADATNGHGKGFDMVMHESRKYGFARALTREVGQSQLRVGKPVAPWVHVNDVAGFIGPEIFRTRTQLVRCCLEDIVMGKLHGLTIGLDICSTLHMDIDLDDLDWCIDQIMPACPAYLMALPTKNDPMLSYLTTAFQDHVRVREKFGYKVNDRMWEFFKRLGVIDDDGRPTEHFGDPNWVYLQYRRRKGDTRSNGEILAEGRKMIDKIEARGVFVAQGYGEQTWELEPSLDQRIRHLYADSKKCIWTELPNDFAAALPSGATVYSQSRDRHDYILHPPTGEVLSNASAVQLTQLRDDQAGNFNVQIVISDGLNVLSLTDDGHLMPYLNKVRELMTDSGYRMAPTHIVVHSGRVRAGYRIGELLYGSLPDDGSQRAILHIIGERPGSGHHAFSVYITAPPVATWAEGGVDHNITKVVSGIADTALRPIQAAADTLRIIQLLASPQE